MDSKKDILWRVYLACGLMVVFALAIVGQLFKVQFSEGDKWRSKAQQLTTKYHTIEARRGNIFADDGSLLATSLPIYEVRMDMNADGFTGKKNNIFSDNVDSLAICLAELFPDKTSEQFRVELKKSRKKKERYHLLRKNVRYTELKKMKTFPLLRLGKYKGGFIVMQGNKRELPFKNLAVRTLGYERKDVQPVGIEGQFASYLKGIEGKRLMQKIGGNNWMPINDDNEIEPQDGNDLVTTIDVNMQDVAQHALLTQLRKSKADHGCVILMDVKTGEIKAIANLTRLDSTNYVEQYNYAIGESTYPGSTFKLASYMVAIDDGLIDANSIVDIEGGQKQFMDRVVRDSHAKESKMSIQRAFEASSNVAVAKIISQYYSKDPRHFTDKLTSFGIGKNVGIELPGEGAARIKKPGDKDWYGTTLPYLAHGYECLLTPLQTLTFYNAVANDGIMVKPMIVKSLLKKGVVIKNYPVTILNKQICKPATIKQAKKMLEGVVENGTAKNLKNDYLKIAGKTGTAVLSGFAKSSTDNDITKKVFQASFVGYFPAEDPKYSCIIVINNPTHDAFYGNVVAGPIFREIADKVYSTNLNMQQALKRDTLKGLEFVPNTKSGVFEYIANVFNELKINSNAESFSSEWETGITASNSISLKPMLVGNEVTPNVKGMGLRDAMFLLENKGYRVTAKGKGTVNKQSIVPGSKIEKDKEIIIELI